METQIYAGTKRKSLRIARRHRSPRSVNAETWVSMQRGEPPRARREPPRAWRFFRTARHVSVSMLREDQRGETICSNSGVIRSSKLSHTYKKCPEIDVKEYLVDPSKFAVDAVSATAVDSGSAPAPSAEEEKKEELDEESDDNMGFFLLQQFNGY
ncbi:unnamed protein product [Fraxinus pennsylvanica]|uniref:Uncharacterized protein n=1 Tax=Fraxinus pennsylvanica TaxID=56036 RepID=A0AAD2DYR0_9LAMI|nr:unnamed protein product [Fraxinus pennsylvanica]